MHVTGSGRTDVGKKREHNEDYLLQVPELGLYMVCDGMGGHAGGEVASETAARTVRQHLEQHREVLDRYDESGPARDNLLRLVDEAVQLASTTVYGIATSERGKAGMGTTLTMLLVLKNIGVMGHVGDTRLYLHRAGRMHQLSEDHTYVNEMVRRGMASAEVAKKGPYANVITRAVGIQSTVRADTLLFDILPGDTLLLCSDGLSKHVESMDEIGRLLSAGGPAQAAQRLVDLANERGGADNITALVLRAETDQAGDDADRSRTTEVNLKLDTLKDIKLFSNLDLGELCKVLNVVRAQEIAKGEVVLREGEPGDSLFAILEGKFVVSRAGQAITWLATGAHFGEMTLFNNRPRSATIEAIEKSRVLVMERERFVELLQKEPQLGVKLLWTFAQVLSLRLDETSVQLYGAVQADTRDTDLTTPFKRGS
ncbi:MAG: cyclic nucleotide-binding domain-containing protein [Deltaproteobacteria bacterium]|nr:cyclic nucleotide-binding domain-containing protein [Deltaproteobacteria bacterium]